MNATIQLLSSGYWLVRFSPHQFIQWRRGTDPKPEDGFGWLNGKHFDAACRLADAPEAGR
jgi:hypothetical protein